MAFSCGRRLKRPCSPLAAVAAGTSAVGIREQGAAGSRSAYVVTAGPVRQLRETDIIF